MYKAWFREQNLGKILGKVISKFLEKLTSQKF